MGKTPNGPKGILRQKHAIELHPRYHDIMRIFDRMRMEGPLKYNELWKAIQVIAPQITYPEVYNFFRKFQANYQLAENIHRQELRDRKKRIAAAALNEVEKNPLKLPLYLRIKLGAEATAEELREIGMVLKERHDTKQESLLEKLIDKARYGDVIEGDQEETSYLDDRATGQPLPELGAGA